MKTKPPMVLSISEDSIEFFRIFFSGYLFHRIRSALLAYSKTSSSVEFFLDYPRRTKSFAFGPDINDLSIDPQIKFSKRFFNSHRRDESIRLFANIKLALVQKIPPFDRPYHPAAQFAWKVTKLQRKLPEGFAQTIYAPVADDSDSVNFAKSFAGYVLSEIGRMKTPGILHIFNYSPQYLPSFNEGFSSYAADVAESLDFDPEMPPGILADYVEEYRPDLAGIRSFLRLDLNRRIDPFALILDRDYVP